MTVIILALLPVFLLIALGYGIRRTGFLDESFWAPADRITFYVFFPALLFRGSATADVDALAAGGTVAALMVAIVLVASLLLLLRRRLGVDGPGFTSIFQGSIRPNTYVGLAAGFALYGDAGVSLLAVAILAFVPLVNVLSTTVLAHYADAGATDWRRTVRVVATNPLIIAVLSGFAVNVAGLPLPGIVDTLLDMLGRPALVLGLLSVGAGLDLAAVLATRGPVLLASALRLAVLPGLAAVLLSAFGVSGLAATAALLFAALPTSATSYVMARQMGGDHTLMAGIITLQTIAAMATLPAWLIMLG